MHRVKSAGFPILLLVFSVAYLFTARALGPLVDGGRLSPSFFPSILGTLAVLISAVLTWRALRSSDGPADTSPTTGVDKYKVLLVTATTALFIFLFQQIGYVFSATTYVLVIILIFSDRTRLPSKFLMALVTAMAVYLLFTQAFNVRLPGLWS